MAGRADQRTLVQSLTDITRSNSAGELTGVAVLDKGYDAESQTAWALVGIDVRTVQGARAVRAMTSGGEQ
jgi:hypothetical protein